MTGDLTQVLHAGTERLPVTLLRPTDVRRAAEHRRRVRRVVGGAALGVAVLAVAVGTVLGGELSTPRPAPAVTPTPTPTDPPEGPFGLAAHPLLTTDQWGGITGGAGSRTALDPRPLHGCTPDPRGQGKPTDSRAGTYREAPRPGTRINEFVLRYADVEEAVEAFAGVYNEFAGCRDPAYDAATRQFQGSLPQGLGYLADEQFVSEEQLKSAKGPSFGPGPFIYQLAVGRDENVVIVIESTGWGDRTLHTIQLAMMRAIPDERGKCAPFCV